MPVAAINKPRSQYRRRPESKRDRGDDQGDLQEHFAQIEAVGFAAGVFGLVLGFVRLAVELLLLVFIAVRFGPVFRLQLGRAFRVFGGHHGGQIGKQLVVVPPYIFGLVIRPLDR
jgi:hypothetical protein